MRPPRRAGNYTFVAECNEIARLPSIFQCIYAAIVGFMHSRCVKSCTLENRRNLYDPSASFRTRQTIAETAQTPEKKFDWKSILRYTRNRGTFPSVVHEREPSHARDAAEAGFRKNASRQSQETKPVIHGRRNYLSGPIFSAEHCLRES